MSAVPCGETLQDCPLPSIGKIYICIFLHCKEMSESRFQEIVPCPLASFTIILMLCFPECKPGLTPVFEAQLNLVTPELVFHPSLDSGVKGGLYDIVQSLVTRIFAMPSLVPRLSPHSGSPHYQVLERQHLPSSTSV